ncbi:unnamed protein product, partial [Amoebophrya sp. A25]
LVPQRILEYETEDKEKENHGSGNNPQANQMVLIEAGESHSGCIDSLGRVYTWGAGGYCRTGHGAETDCCIPKQVDGLRSTPCEMLAFGVLHSLALTRKGKVMGWGGGPATGLLFPGEGLISANPREVEIADKDSFSANPDASPPVVMQIAAGAMHSLALTTSGAIFAWGQSGEGRLGLGAKQAA